MVYSRFAILTIDYTITATGYQIVVTTNHACHLWLRWTTFQPWRHIDTGWDRGAPVDKDLRICFVNFTDQEQEEAGDTYTHTFILEPWESCETRWFYFLGQVSASTSPSESAIFELHRVQPPITTTFYPDKDPEVTCCDGGTERVNNIPPYTWETLHGGAGTSGSASGGGINIAIQCTGAANGYWFLHRLYLLFDTSIILPEATIISAKLRVHGAGKTGTLAAPLFSMALVNSFPLSNTAIVAADYQNIGRTLLSNRKILYADYNGAGWNEFVLNASGRSRITKGGITKFGLREGGYDVPNLPPPWQAGRNKIMAIKSADQAPFDPPELVVTYQP